MKQTPFGEIMKGIGETEQKILGLRMKLRRRWLLKKLFFFIPLPKEFWGGEDYRHLKT